MVSFLLPIFAECIESKCVQPIPEAVLNYNNYSKDPHFHIYYYTDWNGYEVYHLYYYPTQEERAKYPGRIYYGGFGIFLMYDGENVRRSTKEEFNVLELEYKKVNGVCARLRRGNKD